ncbi:hypothetical protein JG688_00016438 [Phytophthora aleatoria]|uniref:Uncharacterized protein n=1 Tax=Phytophthora aleatoria TaxID=2496075 RepID=A0A8J5MCG0_9STRA|nr:hypothetical protein JG688_00016438 [Phytophthora aleatoria]
MASAQGLSVRFLSATRPRRHPRINSASPDTWGTGRNMTFCTSGCYERALDNPRLLSGEGTGNAFLVARLRTIPPPLSNQEHTLRELKRVLRTSVEVIFPGKNGVYSYRSVENKIHMGTFILPATTETSRRTLTRRLKRGMKRTRKKLLLKTSKSGAKACAACVPKTIMP